MTKCTQNFNALATCKIEIQIFSIVDTALGGQTPTWSTESNVWAVVEPKSGKEEIKAQQRESSVTAIFTIRYISDLASTLSGSKRRIKFGTRYYNILSVQNFSEYKGKFEGKAFQVLNCEEVRKEVA